MARSMYPRQVQAVVKSGSSRFARVASTAILIAVVVYGCSSGSDSATDGESQNDMTPTGETGGSSVEAPNILMIITDDQGLDASAQYGLSQDVPATPVIDQLASEGLVFDHAWATPSCTTTRGSLITGQHGVNSGIDTVPDLMDVNSNTLQRTLAGSGGDAEYTSAVIGKWHLAGGNPTNLDHPLQSGVDYYAGTIAGTIDDYYEWPLTIDGATRTSTDYHTTAMTDLAIDWTSRQTSPWFLWLAYVAPHEPFHLPPADLHGRVLSGDSRDIADNPRDYYLAAIEAMDTEIGRLLDSLAPATRENTLIIVLGDNGTPRAVIDQNAYPRNHGKNTLYEGGIAVPLVVSGAGVERPGEREAALVNTVDIFPTLAGMTGHDVPADIDGESFLPQLSSADAVTIRDYTYSEFVSDGVTGWTVRSPDLKLIEYADGSRELYELTADSREEMNLIEQAETFGDVIDEMDAFAADIRTRNSE